MSQNDIVKLRAVELTDYGHLALFLSEFEHGKRNTTFWLEKFCHWWDGNPSFCRDTPRGWLINDNIQIVGFLGCVPHTLMVDGLQCKCYSATTWRVLKKYRRHSNRLAFRLVSHSSNTLLFATTLSPHTRKFMVARHGEKIPWQSNYRLISIICRDTLRRTNIAKKFGMFEHPNPAYSVFPSRIEPNTVPSSCTRFSCVFLKFADERFDVLWRNTNHQFGLTTVRTFSFINWLGAYDLDSRNILTLTQQDVVYGYAIFSIKKVGDYRCLFVRDFWTDFRDLEAVFCLASELRSHGKFQKCDFVQLPHIGDEFVGLLSFLGYRAILDQSTNEYVKIGTHCPWVRFLSNAYISDFASDI